MLRKRVIQKKHQQKQIHKIQTVLIQLILQIQTLIHQMQIQQIQQIQQTQQTQPQTQQVVNKEGE